MSWITSILDWFKSFFQEIENKEDFILVERIYRNIDIIEPPWDNEIITIYAPPKNLGSYMLYANHYGLEIKIHLIRYNKDIVVVKIGNRETIWNLKEKILYTTDPNDIDYWSLKLRKKMLVRPFYSESKF